MQPHQPPCPEGACGGTGHCFSVPIQCFNYTIIPSHISCSVSNVPSASPELLKMIFLQASMKPLAAPCFSDLQQVGIPLQVAQVPLRVTLVQGLVSHLPRVFFMRGDVVAANTYRVLEGEGLMCFPIQRQCQGCNWGKTR